MSRLTRALPVPGAAVSAASLNLDFAQFEIATVGSGSLDANNIRDAAVDLPNMDFGDAHVLQTLESEQLAYNDMLHLTSDVTPSTSSGPATPRPIENASGETRLEFSSGLSVAAGDLLRVYWNLSCRASWSVSDPINPSGLPGGSSTYSDDTYSSGTQEWSDWCWVIHLEWDITSSALANWEPVQGQSDFQGTSPSANGGAYVNQMEATSVVNAFHIVKDGLSLEHVDRGFRPATGSYYLIPDSGLTIYGLRLVVHGVYKAYKILSGSDLLNCLVLDEVVADADTQLEINHGSLMAVVMKGA